MIVDSARPIINAINKLREELVKTIQRHSAAVQNATAAQAVRDERDAELTKSLEKQVGTVRDQAQAREEKHREVGTTIATAIQAVADTVPDYESPQRKKEYDLQWGLFWVTLAGAVAAAVAAGGAIYYAGIAANQARIMQRTYDEIQKQTAAAQCAAKAAQEQATLMRQQLVGTQTAVLYLQPYGIESDGTGKITFINRGAVFGRVVSGSVEVYRLRGTEEYLLAKVPFKNLLFAPYTRSDIAQPDPVIYSVIGMQHGFTLPEIIGLHADTPKQVLKMQVSWQYDNGFGDTGSRTACYSLFATVAWTAADGHQYSGGGGFVPCDEWDTKRKEYTYAIAHQSNLPTKQ